jgi:hypothetical protein
VDQTGRGVAVVEISKGWWQIWWWGVKGGWWWRRWVWWLCKLRIYLHFWCLLLQPSILVGLWSCMLHEMPVHVCIKWLEVEVWTGWVHERQCNPLRLPYNLWNDEEIWWKILSKYCPCARTRASCCYHYSNNCTDIFLFSFKYAELCGFFKFQNILNLGDYLGQSEIKLYNTFRLQQLWHSPHQPETGEESSFHYLW